MATKNMAYDHPEYTTRKLAGGITTAGANTISQRFVAFTAMIAKSAQITVTTAGTSATTGNAAIFGKVSGTTTTIISTNALGTSAIGTTTNITLGDTALAAGDILFTQNGTDATGVAVVGYELLVAPTSNVTV